MQIPILNGIYADASANFRTSYPRNLIPVPKANGISQGYLKPADGIVQVSSGIGVDRGSIVWNGACYRAQGSKLVKVATDYSITIIGDIMDDGEPVSFDYSFDRLAIASSGRLFYYDGAIKQVTDSDIGSVTDVIFVDGYFMTTDSQSLVVTDLADPFSVNPLKYGSAESDPDPIQCLLKIRNEPVAIGKYSCEFYTNVGGSLFPFQRINGSIIAKGAIGRKSACKFLDMVALLGSGRNEPPAIYTGLNGQYTKISTREIDQLLSSYTEEQLSESALECRADSSHQLLYVHLADRTLVYDAAGSAATSEPVWFTIDSGGFEGPAYLKFRNFVWFNNQWLGSDYKTGNLGVISTLTADHFGQNVAWEFSTQIIYNEGRGALFHELELVTLTGRVPLTSNPTIWTSYTLDGETWSQEKARTITRKGQRNSRISWLQQGSMRQWRIQKFRGFSDCFMSFVRLEARLEALNV